MCTDSSGNVYIGCATRIRKVDVGTGIITTIAGTGVHTHIGDGMQATAAQFEAFNIGMDTARHLLYIASYTNDRVYQIDAAGIFHTVAGTGVQGFSGDGGAATAANIYNPEGVAADACGNLYIADGMNFRIRKVTFAPPPSITVTGVTSATVGATVTVNATVSGAGSGYSIKWFRNSTLFSTTSIPVTTYVKGTGTDTITARVVADLASLSCYDSVTSTGHIIAVIPVGVADISSYVASVRVYPNPATDVLMVSAGAGQLRSISITTLPGQVLLSRDAGSSEVRLRIAHLPTGTYLLHITLSDGSKVVRRFVKE